VVDALQALRGVQFTVAGTTVAELGDLTRFDTPSQLMAYEGRTPSECSRGPRRQQGAMTKTGNSHARRALVEGAWASRDPATVSRHFPLRRETPPTVIQEISWKAQVRLCKRYRQLLARGKNVHQVGVAIARALLGFMWAMAQEVLVTPSGHPTERHKATEYQRVWEETQPRFGATLDGVTRPSGILGPRLRQAPDGPKEGGTNPRISAGSTVVYYWLRLFRYRLS
jgi:hypothetical protein